jgi:colicin import membrane protein
MATIIEEVRRPGDSPPDPFRYGWRYVEHKRANGAIEYEQVPLTLEDVLHPLEGDQVTHSNEHQRRRRYLAEVLETQLRHDPTAVELDDVRITWDVPDLGPHGPDIAVILGVRDPHRNWSTFDVAAEGVRPSILFEITSPETASIYRSVKVDEYELAGVPIYVIVDAVSRRRDHSVRLLGYELTPAGYRPLGANERGWFWLAPARTWLGLADGEIICYDEAEQPIGNHRVLTEALAAQAEARLTADRQVQAARQQAQHAEQQARREAVLRADAEQQAAAAAQQARRETQARVAAEQRAAATETRLRELEAELRRMRGG